MKEYSQIQRLISVLIIFILLPYLSGCYSTKIISISDFPLTDSSKFYRYPYVVHTELSKFLLEKTRISDDILSGPIKQIDTSYNAKNKVHLYLLSDTVMKWSTGNIVSIPLDGIAKIKIKSFDKANTRLLIIAAAQVVIGLALFPVLLNNAYRGGSF
jgi:hypothetical protein